ncbi:MAG: TonB-dependent receptor plug domain-containing protein [Acidobacteriaceae bacterium]|nr:TonB-dependent receptor plug domain-containing protein [Acidobacteriaceae bacterium]
MTQTVTVEESAAPVETNSGAQAGTITGNQVRSLNLNNRNFEQLVTLQPGVVSNLPDEVGFGLNNSTSISVNGARVTSNNWTVDGADINDSGSNGTLLNVPSVDAIQEFTLQRSSYDAEYGRSGGGQVLVATKSGTNQFHGDAYEFVRNNYFNANSFFGNLAGQPTPIERYNDFGFTIGGPLFIPKIYKRQVSKTYFFWSEEWRKSSTPNTQSYSVPTNAELGGVFPGDLTSIAPAGCVAYNGSTSTINPSCYSQNSKAYLSNVFSKFSANAGNGTQYVQNYTQLNNYRQDIVRIDQTFTDKIHFFARFMQDDVPENFPLGLFTTPNFPGIAAAATDSPGKNAVGNLTWTLSPTVVNELEFAYSWGGINASLSGVANDPSFVGSLTNNFAYTDPYGRAPTVNISDLNVGLFEGSAPYFERNLDRNVFDNLSWTKGNHTIRAGFTVQWMQKTENASSGAANFTFQPSGSIPAFANFLLGNVATYSQPSRDTVPDLHYFNLEGYIQDDWKVTPKLTLNMGVRYSYFPSPTDVHNTLNNFDPTVYSGAGAPLIDPVSGNFLAGQSLVPGNYTNGIIFPVGAACTAAKALGPQVTCSPYGNLVNPNSNNNIAPRFGFAYDPTGKGKTAIRGGYGVFYDRTLNGIWEQNAFTDPPLVQSTTITNTNFDRVLGGTVSVPLGPAGLIATGTPQFKVPSYQDFNFSVQQELARNTVFEIAYVGTLGRHLLGEVDLNQPTLTARILSPMAQVNAIAPFLGYSDILTRTPNFTSNYNSLQVALTRRVSQGLTLQLSYTWSKNLTNMPYDRGYATYNTYNYNMTYGPSQYNQPQTFVASYVYDLPFFRRQQGFVGHVLGGWEISGITTVASGQSITITQASDPFNSADFPGAPGTYPGGLGIDYTADFAIRTNVVPGQRLKGPGTGTRLQWFNTGAFSPAIGQFGNEGVGVILGPGEQIWDLAALKNFNVGERFSFQLRCETFNTFNHTNFSGVSTNINSNTFGQVTSAHDPRNLQLGLKLNF